MSKRLPMRKISEVLRLTKDGLTQRKIAQSIGVSPTTLTPGGIRSVIIPRTRISDINPQSIF